MVNPILIPSNYNYIGVFVTFDCTLRCDYCINYFEHNITKRKTISGKDWVQGINRIVSREDLPVTLQGGEPSQHPDFYYIVNNIKPELNIDILTNIQFDLDEFIKKVDPNRIKRKAPYASIRVSYHPQKMDLEDTVKRVLKMQEAGFSIGVFTVKHPLNEQMLLKMQEKCKKVGIDFRTKEFLGEYRGKLYGAYKYDGACDKKFKKKVECRTTEFLIDSEGKIYRCHADIYNGKNSIGHILDCDFQIEDKFRDCDYFGHCNPCDTKVKTNRYQRFGHTSVEIKMK